MSGKSIHLAAMVLTLAGGLMFVGKPGLPGTATNGRPSGSLRADDNDGSETVCWDRYPAPRSGDAAPRPV